MNRVFHFFSIVSRRRQRQPRPKTKLEDGRFDFNSLDIDWAIETQLVVAFFDPFMLLVEARKDIVWCAASGRFPGPTTVTSQQQNNMQGGVSLFGFSYFYLTDREVAAADCRPVAATACKKILSFLTPYLLDLLSISQTPPSPFLCWFFPSFFFLFFLKKSHYNTLF